MHRKMVQSLMKLFDRKRAWVRFLSYGVAGGLLVVLIVTAGLENVWSSLRHLTPLSIISLLAVSVPLILISVMKWRIFLRLFGPTPSLWRLSELYLIGYFVNLFLPSQLGGDVVRSVSLSSPGNRTQIAVCTFLERFTGLLAMVLFALCGVLTTKQPFFVTGLVGICFVLAWGGAGALWCGVPRRLIPSGLIAGRIAERLAKMEESLAVVKGTPLIVLRALLFSIFFHLFTIVNTQVAAWVVGAPLINWIDLAVVVPLILLIGGLPLTPSGLGIQEGAWVYFLGYAGVSPAHSLAISIVLRAKTYLLSLLGGVILARDRGWRSSASKVD